jgi:hypothetical protein
MRSSLHRALTAIDAFLYLFLVFCGLNAFLTVWCMAGMLLTAFDISVGILSLPALLIAWGMDLLPATAPSPATLRVGSAESVSMVADYLMAPIIKSGEAFVARCESERAQVEKHLESAATIESRVVGEREQQRDSKLLPLYDQQLSAAREALMRLSAKRDGLVTQEKIAYEEIQAIKKQLGDMRVLAHASFQLGIVLDRLNEKTQVQDEEAARKRLARLTAQMDAAKLKLSTLQDLAVARAAAVAEINHLTVA